MSNDHHNVLIIGASISGLMTALAFHRRGVPVTVLDRDDVIREPVIESKDGRIHRRGTPHVMQPHIFISKLHEKLKEWHPDLIEEMVAAGVNEMNLARCIHCGNGLPPKPKPEDDELSFLASRRYLLEESIRKYAIRQNGINIVPSVSVTKLLTEGSTAPFRVRGVEVLQDGETKEWTADTIIDASGRTTKLLDPLKEHGADIRDFHHQSKSAYYTRHYRLLPGKQFPKYFGLVGAMFEDMAACTFFADENNFVATIVVNQDDPILFSNSMTDPEIFEEIFSRVKKVAHWIEKDFAEPISPVVGWSNMDFFWRELAPGGREQVLGYFPVGDTVIRSNPKYGRGCTWGAIGADLLSEAICSSDDQASQLHHYREALEAQFREEWNMILSIDKEDQRTFEIAAGLAPTTLKSKMMSAITSATMGVATAVDPDFYRSFIRGFYGLALPTDWTKNPINWLRILRANLIPSDALKLAREHQKRPSREELREIIASRSEAAA